MISHINWVGFLRGLGLSIDDGVWSNTMDGVLLLLLRLLHTMRIMAGVEVQL